MHRFVAVAHFAVAARRARVAALVTAQVAAALVTLATSVAHAQVPDPMGLARLKDFQALRASSNNADSASNDDSKRPLPGETVTLLEAAGPGVVSHMWITVAGNEYAWPRLLRLRVYYDGSTIPSVDAPVGDFFGVGHGMERELNSLAIRNSSSGRSRNSYWPMPFAKSVKVTITNEGRRRLYNLYYHVDWQKLKALPPNTAYFHARYRQALPTKAGAFYDILNVTGRGHYVGTVFSVVQAMPGWFGEGDDLFFVDGARKPQIEGTGTEDYFNDAWSLRVADGPYAGVTVAEGTDVGSRMTAYRWHLADPVPFTKQLRFAIEHVGWTFNPDGSERSASEERPDLFSTVAFWYQQGIARDQPEPPYGAARLPHGNARQIEVERDLTRVTATKGTLSVQKEVFWGKDLLVLAATGPGARVDIPFDVAADGRYELVAQVGEAPDYGIYQVLVDGQPVRPSPGIETEPGANIGAGTVIDGFYKEVFVGEDRLITWATLARGTHTVSFVCTGKNAQSTGFNLGLDALVVARVADGSAAAGTRDSASATDPADRMRRIGALGTRGAAQLPSLLAGLRDATPAVREAALWAFTQLKGGAAAAG
ncbi:MAG: DUF2961 domain-containing protein, partial [Gemmatimonadetes bacterium]|nr:DUF2961 domain-containing protein [Gemmatimonadota bacterium]